MNSTGPSRELNTELLRRFGRRRGRFGSRRFLTWVGGHRRRFFGHVFEFESGRQKRGNVFGVNFFEERAELVAEVGLLGSRALEARW